MEGEILHIQQVNGVNTNSRTAQLTLEDIDGNEIWDGSAQAHNATHDHEFVATRRVMAEKNTLKCTISGDPGTGGYSIDAIIYLQGIDWAPS